MTTLDWIGIGLLLVFSLLGIFRGGAWQFRRFLGVLFAMFAARLLSPIAGPTISSLVDPTQPKLGLGIAYSLVFLLTLCILALLFKMLAPSKRTKTSKKRRSAEDDEEENAKQPHRLLGFGFGVLTACALYSTMITSILLLDPKGGTRPSFASSQSARWTSRAIESLGGTFPIEARQSVATPHAGENEKRSGR